ncbi:MAG: hypothetical protein NT069_09020 [Planctomycetota bacterium]|nr:hypothetical protein [Planctomycetota bacterium]
MPSIASDIDAAIKSLEEGDFEQFLELYAPVTILRDLRTGDAVANAANDLKSIPEFKTQMLTLLGHLKKGTPKYDASKGLATFEIDLSPAAPAEGDEVAVPRLPDVSNVKSKGLGGDLPKVLTGAIALLEKREYAKFVDALFPLTEIVRLNQEDGNAALVRQFEETPELRTAMLADFKRMQQATPKMTEKGQVAEFALKAEKGASARTVKLQKSGSDWRLYDDSPRVVAELARVAKLKPASAVETIQMERIGGNWRFVDWRAR